MKRGVYSALWRLALPAVLARLWWRGRQEPGYRKHWGERLGRYGAAPAPRLTILVHAVSVGETRAAEPLVVLASSRLRHRAVDRVVVGVEQRGSVIHREVARLERTVLDFIDFARPPAPQQCIGDIKPIVSEAVD